MTTTLLYRKRHQEWHNPSESRCEAYLGKCTTSFSSIADVVQPAPDLLTIASWAAALRVYHTNLSLFYCTTELYVPMPILHQDARASRLSRPIYSLYIAMQPPLC